MREKNTVVINAFGGSGAGKTTACLDIVSELKKRGYIADYVQEYATELVWEGKIHMLDGSERNQAIMLNEQNHRIERLRGKVDFIVTDSPLLLNSTYNKELTPEYEKKVMFLFSKSNNFNFVVKRDESTFSERGRIHNLQESKIKDKEIEDMLKKHGLTYGKYSHDNINKVIDNSIKVYKGLNVEVKSKSNDNYYSEKEYEEAKNKNIVDYLMSMGYGLKSEGHYYRGVTHSSLVIHKDGAWSWNAKNEYGNSSVNLLSLILQHDYNYSEKDAYINAVKKLANTEGINMNYAVKENKKEEKQVVKDLKVPEKSETMKRSIAYLCQTRKLDYGIVSELISQGKIYETKERHNVCFVAKDENKEPKHIFMRGTFSEKPFKQDIEGSDKTYAFTLDGNPLATKVYVFESAIDAISHASLYKMQNVNYKDGYRISLNGTSFLGLEKFLKQNPQVKEIVACLDNDEAGNRRATSLCKEYFERGYKTFRQPPQGKDYNDQLIDEVAQKESIEDIVKNFELER